MIILLSGCSGVGKNTVIQELLKTEKNLKYLKNVTSRQRRPNEMDDRLAPYFYISTEEFKKRIENGEFYEYEFIHGNYYGTLKKSIEDIKTAKEDYIKDIGVLGQETLKKAFGKSANIITIFLSAPREVLVERLIGRGEKQIELRLERMDFENGFKKDFDYVIENIDLNETLNKIKEIRKSNFLEDKTKK